MAFWIWVGFDEVPAVQAPIGGALVSGAVITDIGGMPARAELHEQRLVGNRVARSVAVF